MGLVGYVGSARCGRGRDGHRAQVALGDGTGAATDRDHAGLDELADAERLEQPEQVTKQLNKLVEVIKIVELDPESSVTRELVLVKVAATAENRGQVLDTVQLFRAKVVDIAPDTVTIQAIGNSDKLGDLLLLLQPFGIRELVQSGQVAIGRGSRSISERNLRPVTVPAPPAAG